MEITVNTPKNNMNIIIANPSPTFAESLKTHFQKANIKVIEIIVVLEHLIETIEQNIENGVEIHGVLISSDLSKKLNDKRLDLLGSHLLAIRKRYSQINIVFLSNETEGHPLLAELVNMGVYNIFIKSSKNSPLDNISVLTSAFVMPKTFSEVENLREVDSSIPWRRTISTSPSELTVNVNKEQQPSIIEKEMVVVEKEKIVEREVVRIVEKLVEIEKVREIKVINKTIVIGSLYSGAGSTYITLALARLLNYIGISTAVVEHPSVVPTMHTLLFGEKNAPKDYSFLTDQIIKEGRVGKRSNEWVNEGTTWYPINPNGLGDSIFWTTDMTLKMLYSIKEPVVLMDVSNQWNDVSVRETCLDADEVIFVADPLIATKYTRPDCVENSKMLFELKEFGINIDIVVNRDTEMKKRQWLQALPYIPEAFLTEIPYNRIVKSVWDEEMIFDDPELRVDLLSGLYPILKKLVPQDYPIKNLKKIMKKNTGIFNRFSKRK